MVTLIIKKCWPKKFHHILKMGAKILFKCFNVFCALKKKKKKGMLHPNLNASLNVKSF